MAPSRLLQEYNFETDYITDNNALSADIEELIGREGEIEKLLQLGAVVPCIPVKDQFISSIFLHPKSDGTWRFILNVKEFNNYVNTCHLKLEDLRTAINLMHPCCFMSRIDLKNAYYLISVKKKDRLCLYKDHEASCWLFEIFRLVIHNLFG